jgi:hypothetical protein
MDDWREHDERSFDDIDGSLLAIHRSIERSLGEPHGEG